MARVSRRKKQAVRSASAATAVAGVCLLAACGTIATTKPTISVTSAAPHATSAPCPAGHASPARTARSIQDVRQVINTIEVAIYGPYERGDFNPAVSTSGRAISHATSAGKQAAGLMADAIRQTQLDTQTCTHLAPLLRTTLSQLNDLGPALTRGDLASVAGLHASALTLQHSIRNPTTK